MNYKRKTFGKRGFDDAEKQGMEHLLKRVREVKDKCKGEQTDE